VTLSDAVCCTHASIAGCASDAAAIKLAAQYQQFAERDLKHI
jgi:hypothetical protein